MIGVSMRTENPNTGTQGEMSCDDSSRDQSDVSTNQSIPVIVSNTRSWERNGTDSPLDPSECFCWHCDFRLLAFRTVREQISVVLSHSGYGNFLWQPWETDTSSYVASQQQLSWWAFFPWSFFVFFFFFSQHGSHLIFLLRDISQFT